MTKFYRSSQSGPEELVLTPRATDAPALAPIPPTIEALKNRIAMRLLLVVLVVIVIYVVASSHYCAIGFLPCP
jgi:hypothetical protein